MSKRHPNSNQPQRGTGSPSGAERSQHESARGEKIPSLSDLINEVPNLDSNSYIEYLQTKTDDRSSAIMGAAFVEQCLEAAIKCRIADPGKDIAESWFRGPNAPFSSFSSKIQLGMALVIYGKVTHSQLVGIKDIRNIFAHRSLPLDFKHPAIVKAFHKVAPFMKGSKSEEFRSAYVIGCFVIGKSFIDDAFKHGGRELEVSFP